MLFDVRDRHIPLDRTDKDTHVNLLHWTETARREHPWTVSGENFVTIEACFSESFIESNCLLEICMTSKIVPNYKRKSRNVTTEFQSKMFFKAVFNVLFLLVLMRILLAYEISID